MQEIRNKLDSIQSDVHAIKLDVAKNTLSLENHMARTRASEVRIEYLERIFMGLTSVAILGGLVKWLIS